MFICWDLNQLFCQKNLEVASIDPIKFPFWSEVVSKFILIPLLGFFSSKKETEGFLFELYQKFERNLY